MIKKINKTKLGRALSAMRSLAFVLAFLLSSLLSLDVNATTCSNTTTCVSSLYKGGLESVYNLLQYQTL